MASSVSSSSPQGSGSTWPTPSLSSLDGDESTKSFIERLSAAGVYALNAGDHDFTCTPAAQETLAHISADWRGQIDTYAHAKEVTFAEQSAMWKQRREEHPDVHFQIVHMSSDIDEEKGVALVFMEMEVSGLGDIKLQAMNELTWRRIKDTWLLCHTLGLRGSKMNTGGFG